MSRLEFLNNLIKDVPEHFSLVEGRIFCIACNKTIKCSKTSHFTQHVSCKTHNLKIRESGNFFEELCEAFLAANIPLKKLNNPVLKNVLNKNTKRKIPDESTIRKYYVPKLYKKTIESIKSDINNNYIWVSADEIVDIKDRCIVNVVIGILHPSRSYKPYLIATRANDTISAEIVADIVFESVSFIINSDLNKVLLFVSDGEACMLKAGQLLKNRFPNMLHISCIVYALNRISEFIRNYYSDVDNFINNLAKILLKSPYISLYKVSCPNLQLPPEPVATHCGTWLETCTFYNNNFTNITNFLSLLNNDFESIQICKTLLKDSELSKKLIFLKNNFSCIPETIKTLEANNLSLVDSLYTFNSLIVRLKSTPDEFGELLSQKIDEIIQQNPDLHILYNICFGNIQNPLTPHFDHFKSYILNAPVTSCEVEKTFSLFKNILTAKRTNFSIENLEKVCIITCNST